VATGPALDTRPGRRTSGDTRTLGLHGLQRYLERIYDIDTDYNVDHFLITDRRLARGLESDSDVRDCHEKLLVREHEDGDDLDVGLYLDPEIVDVIRRNDPLRSLNDGNLWEFWIALEGVSHFLYLVWNARHRREVSLFELELQAEVDKFAAAVFLLGGQHNLRVPRNIYDRLFGEPGFDHRLAGPELRRYRDANRYAAIYCGNLRRDCMETRRSSMVRDLRRFYRLTHHRKLEHIKNS
jgi:hypothetical protein